MFERMELWEGFMFATLQHRWPEHRKTNLRLAFEPLCGQAVTIVIVPPGEQKLLKYSEKRVKWGHLLCGWGLLRQRPPFCVLLARK